MAITTVMIILNFCSAFKMSHLCALVPTFGDASTGNGAFVMPSTEDGVATVFSDQAAMEERCHCSKEFTSYAKHSMCRCNLESYSSFAVSPE
jgi:hypothetical protein